MSLNTKGKYVVYAYAADRYKSRAWYGTDAEGTGFPSNGSQPCERDIWLGSFDNVDDAEVCKNTYSKFLEKHDDLDAAEMIDKAVAETRKKHPSKVGDPRLAGWEKMSAKSSTGATAVGNRTAKDMAIVREGTHIILPPEMSFDEGIEWLERMKTEDEREVKVNEKVDAYPLDGAHALAKALSEKFGWTGLIPTPGFWGSTPPSMIGVEVSPTETVQVPWGRMQVSGVEGFIETGFAFKDGKFTFVIQGVVRRKSEKIISDLAKRTREIVKTDSLYRGKAIRVSFETNEPSEEKPFDPFKAPKFMDLSRVREEELVLPATTRELVNVNLFTPIERSAECRKHGIPLKRGILLYGPYGTGKTLTAYMAARKAEQNGWTFVYLEDVAQLQQAITFARQYQPAVVFAEDVDHAMKGERGADTNAILNVIDGIENKNAEVAVVLTTNHVELIHPAMMRPGRLDAVIEIGAPDADAVMQLVRLYAGNLLAPDADLTGAGEAMAGQIPAVIREVIERSKLAAISRAVGNGPLRLEPNDLIVASRGMLEHLRMIARKEDTTPNVVELIGQVIGHSIAQGVDRATVSNNGKERATPTLATK